MQISETVAGVTTFTSYGNQNTQWAASTHYYWKSMNKEIKELVKRCDICIQISQSNRHGSLVENNPSVKLVLVVKFI